jgi:hypothetical protein
MRLTSYIRFTLTMQGKTILENKSSVLTHWSGLSLISLLIVVDLAILHFTSIRILQKNLGSNSMKSKYMFNIREYDLNGLELLPPFKGAGKFKLVCDRGQ